MQNLGKELTNLDNKDTKREKGEEITERRYLSRINEGSVPPVRCGEMWSCKCHLSTTS